MTTLASEKNILSSGIPQSTVIKVALLTEGFALVISYIWLILSSVSFQVSASSAAIYQGIKATGPLIAFNFAVFGVLANTGSSRYTVYREFRDQIVYPLCKNMSWLGALFLAICSGVAEEFLFRGVMYHHAHIYMGPTLAAIVTSLLFAYVHFIGILRRFLVVFIFYLLFGLYFAYLVEWTGDLTPAIVAHGLYNFLAIILIKHFAKPQ